MNVLQPLEEQGRFLAFQKTDKRFLTKAAAALLLGGDSGNNENEEEQDCTFRLRAHPPGSKLPELFEGDIFTLHGKDYRICELYWGYKGWAKRHFLRASNSRVGQRSTAETVAFAVCSCDQA
jgi:hypothetical protein